MLLEGWLVRQGYVEAHQQVGHQWGQEICGVERDIAHGNKGATFTRPCQEV